MVSLQENTQLPFFWKARLSRLWMPIPTVSPLIIPLLYCHINGFQRVFSVEKPWPGGQKRRGGWAAPPVAWGGAGVVAASRARHRVVPERARGPERCHASGAAVDVCGDAPAEAPRA